jgi:uncharacterized protein
MATGRRFDPRRFDVRSFAAEGASVGGHWPLTGLARLASAAMPGAVADAAPVAWKVEGARAKLDGAGSQAMLSLLAEAVLSMQCQRCLQPVDVPLDVERRLFFVEGEDAAAALDAESEDDVLALAPAVDLQSLIEDELLLALPLIPRHDVCPEPLLQPVHDDAEPAAEEHPFAALAALKGDIGGA